jgi:spore protease
MGLQYTDLALEAANIRSEDQKTVNLNPFIDKTTVIADDGGRVITFESDFNIISDKENGGALQGYLARELKTIMEVKLLRRRRILVIGLGNRGMTADALGPRVVDRIKVDGEDGSLSAFTPSVKGLTGLEPYDVVKGVSDRIKPDVIIAIDTLASRKVKRISSAFQISNRGINPGSGVGNTRAAINSETVGVPVIVIGVPLVVYAKTLARDVLSDFLDNPARYELPERAAETIRRSLDYKPSDLVVTPKDIDLIVDAAADIIAGCINQAFV